MAPEADRPETADLPAAGPGAAGAVNHRIGIAVTSPAFSEGGPVAGRFLFFSNRPIGQGLGGVSALARLLASNGLTARKAIGADPPAARNGRCRFRYRDSRNGRYVNRDLDGRRVVRVTGGDWNLNDVMRPRPGNGEHRLALKFCGLKCRAKRLNRGFLLTMTGFIASQHPRCANLNGGLRPWRSRSASYTSSRWAHSLRYPDMDSPAAMRGTACSAILFCGRVSLGDQSPCTCNSAPELTS